uniref:Uncharacterized protein n=1 Tax=Eustigmatophyceae sp. Mont 10/10-1w TaxID=2506145 RepID=A0A451FMR4_9STRA|nr:hypothetical protein Ycf95 [Eustigmatophyceae sp. Mont 10/10-1w]QAA11705.1 hypothetical protein Ycf95 [Eustigmatophyceae sp. Mont 10/10-1w]
MSHALNIIQKTDISKSMMMLMHESKRQNSKIKIRKNEVIVDLGNESRLIFYVDTKTLLKIENKHHSSFNFNTNLGLLQKQTNSINNPLGLQESVVSSVNDLKRFNKRVKIKEVQLSVSKKKSRLILDKVS